MVKGTAYDVVYVSCLLLLSNVQNSVPHVINALCGELFLSNSTRQSVAGTPRVSTRFLFRLAPRRSGPRGGPVRMSRCICISILPTCRVRSIQRKLAVLLNEESGHASSTGGGSTADVSCSRDILTAPSSCSGSSSGVSPCASAARRQHRYRCYKVSRSVPIEPSNGGETDTSV